MIALSRFRLSLNGLLIYSLNGTLLARLGVLKRSASLIDTAGNVAASTSGSSVAVVVEDIVVVEVEDIVVVEVAVFSATRVLEPV